MKYYDSIYNRLSYVLPSLCDHLHLGAKAWKWEGATCRGARNCLVQSIGSAGRAWNNLAALASSGAFSSVETGADLSRGVWAGWLLRGCNSCQPHWLFHLIAGCTQLSGASLSTSTIFRGSSEFHSLYRAAGWLWTFLPSISNLFLMTFMWIFSHWLWVLKNE